MDFSEAQFLQRAADETGHSIEDISAAWERMEKARKEIAEKARKAGYRFAPQSTPERKENV